MENNGVNQPIGLARVGNFPVKRFSDFDVETTATPSCPPS